MLRCALMLCAGGALLLLAACGGGEDPGSEAEAGPRYVVDGVVACFPDPGPIAFLVEGVPVPEAAVDRFAQLLRRRTPALNEEQARRKAVLDQILPMAASYARYRDRLKEASAKLAGFADQVAAGKDFKELAEEVTDDPQAKRNGGSLGFLGRDRGRSLIHLSMQDMAWAIEVGGVSPPIATALGLNLVSVASERPGASEASDEREVHYILVAYDPDSVRMGTWPGVLKAIVEQARIEIRDDEYKELLPSRLWHR